MSDNEDTPTNVVKGPWPEVFKPNAEDRVQMEAAEYFVNEIADAIFGGLSNVFDNFDDPCYSKDYALMVHSIRSVVYKLNNQYHPCQDLSEELFIQYDDGSLEMCDGVDVDFE
jgi:hypothetical protein